MRILILSPVTPYLPCHEHPRLSLAHRVRHLAARHRLALVAASSAADTPAQRHWARDFCDVTETVPGGQGRRPLGARPGAALTQLRAAARAVIERFTPDVLHLEDALLAPLARLDGIPTVLTLRESPARRARELRRAARTLWDWARAHAREHLETVWERRWLRGVDACVTSSAEDGAAIERRVGHHRVEVVAGGVDTDHHAYRRAGQPGRLVFTGNLAWPPSAEAAVRLAHGVLPRVRRHRPQAELILAGPAAAAVRALGKLPGVRVTGAVSDLRPTIWSASVYLSPVAPEFGIRNKVLEAMALGTPVVASSVSLTGLEGAVSGQHVLVADSEAAMSDVILKVLCDPALAETLARNARSLVERHYHWSTVAQRYGAVFARVAAGAVATGPRSAAAGGAAA